MGNLSSAIIEARKRHEAEIAERLKRRQMRQRAEIERLNSSAVVEAPKPVPVEPEPPAPTAEPAAIEPEPEPVPIPEPPATLVDVASPPAVAAPEPPPEPPRGVPMRLLAAESFDAPVAADELETPPDGRYLKLRNDIIDRIKPYLTGNQFAVYLEIYRQTIGRGRTAAWFRTRDIQSACNLGSDNTVRDAYPVLEQKRLIKLDPNRRPGSPRGLFVTVLSVERALERLERADRRPAQATPPIPAPADLEPLTLVASPPTGDAAAIDRMTREYGVSPTVAPQLLERLGAEDAYLLPYLFRRLDRSITAGKVHNPAGLLRVWIESFDAWRPELAAEHRREEEARRAAEAARSHDELMIEWFRQTDAEAERRVAELDPAAREALDVRGREELSARSAAVRSWSEQQWRAQLDTFARSEIRRELPSFDEWLARRR
jgi:hypothetical protein